MRVGGHERVELGGKDDVPACLELRGDARLVRREACLLEAGRLSLCELLVREVGQGRPAPEPERLLRPARSDELLEPLGVELAGLDPRRYPGARVTIRPAPSALRSAWT